MTEPVQPLTYRGKIDTVENLARTLIVASAVQPAGQVFQLPLTMDSARQLGRALEWSIEMAARHAKICAAAEAQMAVAKEMQATAEALAESAGRQLNLALIWLAVSAGFMLAGATFWWLA